MSNGASKGLARFLPEFIVTIASSIVVAGMIGIYISVDRNSLDIRELKTTVQNLSANIAAGMSDRFTGADAEILRRRVEKLEDRANGVTK